MAALENKEVVRECLNAIWRGDEEALQKHPGISDQARNGFIKHVLPAFPDWTGEVQLQVSEGDWVATWAVVHGTHSESLFGLPPTGRRVEFNQMSLMRVQNGRVVQAVGVPDWLTAFRQLGAVLRHGGDPA
jgi:predicted ester cyclase